MPAPEVDRDLLFVFAHEALDERSGAFRLPPVAGIEEDRRLIARDDHAVLKGFAEVVFQLLCVEAILQRIERPVVAEVDLQTPVVVRGHQ
jgi:hypothetical protein